MDHMRVSHLYLGYKQSMLDGITHAVYLKTKDKREREREGGKSGGGREKRDKIIKRRIIPVNILDETTSFRSSKA